MEFSSRRYGFAACIDLGKLERETRKFLYAGFIAAILFHLGIAVLVDYQAPEQIAAKREEPYRRMKVDIIEIPSSGEEAGEASAPFAIPYIPEGRLPVFKRPAVDMKEFFSRGEFRGNEYGGYLDRQIRDITQQYAESLPKDTGVTFTPRISIPLPRFNIPYTGAHRAEIIIPPGDKLAVQGYIRIPFVWGGPVNLPDTLYINRVRHLARALNRYTNIGAEAHLPGIYLGGNRNSEAFPVLYIPVDTPFALNDEQVLTLAWHVDIGGLIIIDNIAREDDLDHIGRSVRETMRKFIGPRWSSRRLPKNHILYHCFFDFDDGAPPDNTGSKVPGAAGNDLTGYFNGTELVGVYCPQGYGRLWADQRNEAQCKIGVNMVVFALTRYSEWYIPETGEIRYVAKQAHKSW